MVLVSLVDPSIIPDTPGSPFWVVGCCDNCDSILVNLFLDLKVSFVIYQCRVLDRRNPEVARSMIEGMLELLLKSM